MRIVFRFHRKQKRSGVIILTLLVMVLLSVIILGLLASASVERQITEATYQQRRALSMAMLGFQSGMAQLRDALGAGTNSWDNPYANFLTTPPAFFWSVSPGMLTRWSYTNSAPLTNIPLFSYTSDGNTNLVDLNRPLADGSYPIIGITDASTSGIVPRVAVQFVNVLQNPTTAPSASNPIIGRFAFWIDDENAKININVADGTQKYTTNSLGVGSPTEVSLQVLSQGGSTLSTALATNIVQIARNSSFHSAREILRASTATPDLYTNNIFDLTDHSRSPDLNVFGQPKMAIMPLLGDPDQYGTTEIINGITLQPEAGQIYPTPNQISFCPIADPFGNTIYVPWPFAFRAEQPNRTFGRNVTWGGDINLYDFSGGGYFVITGGGYAYNNGAIISSYMAGFNQMGTAITWPVFPITATTSTGTGGFKAKYTNRQIDEIAVQIVTLGSKLISSDYPNPLSSDYPANNTEFGEFTYAPADDAYTILNTDGTRFNCAPYIFPGWLSKQWVIGVGRAPKVIGMGAHFQTHPATGTAATTNFPSAYLTMDLWLEEWIPGAYKGGNYLSRPIPNQQTQIIGNRENQEYLNVADVPQDIGGGDQPHAAELPKPPGLPQFSTNLSYWANQVLTDTDDQGHDQGIDFNEYHTYDVDSDQLLATNHPWDQTPGGYTGAETQQANSPFLMIPLADVATGANPNPDEWPPGEVRCVTSQSGDLGYLYMKTNAGSAGNQTLHIGGGIQIQHNAVAGSTSDYDPVPLESIRGQIYNPNNYYNLAGNLAGDNVVDATNYPYYAGPRSSWLGTNAMTGATPMYDPTAGVTVRDRNLASVIPLADNSIPNAPVPLTLTIPPPNSFSTANTEKYVYATVTDPLVNKFPGDWKVRISTTPLSPSYWPAAPGGKNVYSEGSSILNAITSQSPPGDPDSFWAPQMDCAYSFKTNLAAQTLIPRSARMPSVGYLQYTRTGIIPDDETTPYQQQHGTPFRLLSYAPLSDSAHQQTTAANSAVYPDWALLDLFYVPSILNSYGGPYANFTNLAAFGTFGGATAGRINPNGSVIYTTNATVPQPDVTRLLPLEASVYGLAVNQTFTGSASTPDKWGYTGGTTNDLPASAMLASNIALYIRNNGPLRMPSEICNIPAIAALHAPVNPTRNDLVRQMVGELTTQSNVFSVWTVGQTIQKAPGNSNYGEFEAGDQVLGEVRLHLIVERYLDPGTDGVIGNAVSPGYDNAVGSLDDTADSNHPYNPKYLYRVVRSEEVR